MEKERQLEALKIFRDHVIQNAKNNLSAKNSTGSLQQSLEGEVAVNPNSITLYFEMLEYGFYQDQGVRGVKSGRSLSDFQFGSGTGVKGGLTKGIKEWVKRKGLKFRDKRGKFISYDMTAQFIIRSIWNRGIKPSLFFTRPFEQAFKNLPDEMVELYGLEAEELFDVIMKENFKNYGD